MVAALLRHLTNREVQLKVCQALSVITHGYMPASIRAGIAGAARAVVGAMRAHAGDEHIELSAFLVLTGMLHGDAKHPHAENMIKVWNAGAVETVVEVMRVHAANELVQHEACETMWILCIGIADDDTRRVDASMIEAVVATMRGHVEHISFDYTRARH